MLYEPIPVLTLEWHLSEKVKLSVVKRPRARDHRFYFTTWEVELHHLDETFLPLIPDS